MKNWHWQEMPHAKEPSVPAWLLDIHIEWMDGSGNRPDLCVKADHDLGSWPNKVWHVDGSRYFSVHSGLYDQLYHDGPVTESADGSFTTPNLGGFGGSAYELPMVDGRHIELRGPWSGSAPEGYHNFIYVNTSRYKNRPDNRKWYDNCGSGGLYMSNPVMVAAISKFQPDVKIARILTPYGDTYLEPYKAEWGMPKDWWLRKNRAPASY